MIGMHHSSRGGSGEPTGRLTGAPVASIPFLSDDTLPTGYTADSYLLLIRAVGAFRTQQGSKQMFTQCFALLLQPLNSLSTMYILVSTHIWKIGTLSVM